MSEGTFSTVDQVALNIERAMQSRRQYFAAPVVSGVGYAAAAPVPSPVFPSARDPASDDTNSSAAADSPSAGALSPFFLRTGTPDCSPPPAATFYSSHAAAKYTVSDVSMAESVPDSPAAVRYAQSEARQAAGARPPYRSELRDGAAHHVLRQPAHESAGAGARHDRDVALRRVELLTTALDEARHQLVDKDRELERLSALCDARDETVEQLEYECQRLQACARRDQLYQTHCALALLSTQEEYARRALVLSEEKWRLSTLLAEQCLHREQQQRHEERQRWAHDAKNRSLPGGGGPDALTSDEPALLEMMMLMAPLASLRSPLAAAQRPPTDPASPLLHGRSASLPVSPRSRRAPLTARSADTPSHSRVSGRTDSSMSAVKTGLLAEVTAAKKELESDLALLRDSLHREQARCRARDDELTRLRQDLAQERQLSAELQHEVDDMVMTEFQLRESVARSDLAASEAPPRAALAWALCACLAKDDSPQSRPPPRDTSLSSGSHFSTPVRQPAGGAADAQDKAARRTPPNRTTPPPPVSPLPSPSSLPAIRLREAQLEHYKRHMDPFDDSWAGSVDASMGSLAAGGLAALDRNTASSPVRTGTAQGGFALHEVRSMVDQLLKSYLMPLKISVESMRASGDAAREQQRGQLQEMARTLDQLQNLATHQGSSPGTTRDEQLTERIGSIVTDCHDTLARKLEKLQETQVDALRHVQETRRVSTKAARILSHNDVVMDSKLKDIVACQSALSRQQLASALRAASPGPSHGRACASGSPSQGMTSSQGVSPEGRDGDSGSGSPCTGASPPGEPLRKQHSSDSESPRVAKQVSFQMPLFEGPRDDGRKTSVMEMSRSGLDGTSTSHLMTEGEEALFRPQSVAFASPPSHVWDLVDSDDESVPPLPTGTGFRTPYDIDGAS